MAPPPLPAWRTLTFPVDAKVSYWDDFGACRDGCSRTHEGNDLMGQKMMPLVAANDAVVVRMRTDAGGNSGNYVMLRDSLGWEYWYLHMNNDTPGTDDGLNLPEHTFAPGIAVGTWVQAGQLVGYLGDSGNAEFTSPHLHFELHRPDGAPVDPYTSLRFSQGLSSGAYCRPPSNPPRTPDVRAVRGYWALSATGDVFAYGEAPALGTAAGALRSGVKVVDIASTRSGLGYWLVDAAGKVYAFGDAPALGDLSGRAVLSPAVAIDTTPTGRGYWLTTANGAVFTFGDAKHYGSTAELALNAQVISMARTRSGKGYWLLAKDGGIFAFGDAKFYGSTGGMQLNAPVISMVKSRYGYLLLAADGGTFTFGDAKFYGSLPGTGECAPKPAVAMARTNTGKGYFILQTDGAIRAFGDAKLYGDPSVSAGNGLQIEVMPYRS